MPWKGYWFYRKNDYSFWQEVSPLGKNAMAKRTVSVVWAVAILLCLVSTAADCQRALVVTTGPNQPPTNSTPYGALYPFADLVGAGIPFDVRTYSKFLTVDLSPYDIIILTGHTSPVP